MIVIPIKMFCITIQSLLLEKNELFIHSIFYSEVLKTGIWPERD